MEEGRTLRDIFGGRSDWLRSSVPGGTHFVLCDGRVTGPAGIFVQSKTSRLWHRAHSEIGQIP